MWLRPAVALQLLGAGWLLFVTPAEGALTRLDPSVFLNSPKEWPPPRGPDGNYSWVFTHRARESAMSYIGSNERLRLAVDRMLKGVRTVVATIGGSITAGQGAVDAPNWPLWLFQSLQQKYGKQVYGHNGAVGGTLSGYMSACHNMHVPKDVDIVFVEYSVNDQVQVLPILDNAIRRPFERLLRKLLQYPKRPAVVLVHTYMWSAPTPIPGAFYTTAERDFLEYSLYYGLPSVSLKVPSHELMVENYPGFSPSPFRASAQAALRYKAFYWDRLHPDGNTGARLMAELSFHLVVRTAEDLSQHPVEHVDVMLANATLRAPIVVDNYESTNDRCFIGNHFTDTVKAKTGFEWINEAPQAGRPKWGMVATKPGSVLQLSIDTRAASTIVRGLPTGQENVLVELAYLRSYEKMGIADVSCVSGCSCAVNSIDGHTTERNSQLHLHRMFASQHADCWLEVKVTNLTSSGQHKVKIAGVMVSEESGSANGVRNFQAIDYVHDIAMRAKDNVFEVMNHA